MSDADFNAGTTSDPLGDLKTGKSTELDNLALYVTSLKTTAKSPYRNSDGSLTTAGAAGKSAFIANGCDTCHSGADFTDTTRHDVGTIQTSSGQGMGTSLAGLGFKTPTLKGLWLSAPYLHNGQAATLGDVLNNTTHVGSLSAQEKSDIEQYLLSIDDIEAAPPEIPGPFQASLGFSGTQGLNQWFYQAWDGTSYQDMSWDAGNGRWAYNGTFSIVADFWMHPDGTDSVRKFLVPETGNVRILGNLAKAGSALSGDGINGKILLNSTQVWPAYF